MLRKERGKEWSKAKKNAVQKRSKCLERKRE